MMKTSFTELQTKEWEIRLKEGYTQVSLDNDAYLYLRVFEYETIKEALLDGSRVVECIDIIGDLNLIIIDKIAGVYRILPESAKLVYDNWVATSDD